MRVYSYKITRDFGFAPNPFGGVCTLATCKPQIRTSAVEGDIIVGCGSAANNLTARSIFIMRVSGKLSFQQYWDDPRFREKRPFFKGSRCRAYGDNIYHHDDEGNWVQERSHHSFADGSLNESNLRTDTGSDNVLLGDDFVYYGRNAPLIPQGLRNFEGDDLYPTARSHRAKFSPALISEVDGWFKAIPVRGCIGRPTAWQ